MIIFSELHESKKFQEIIDFMDCNHIASDVCVFLTLANGSKEDCKKAFLLAQQLQKNEVEYAVLIDEKGEFDSDVNTSYYEQCDDEQGIEINENTIPLKFLLLMFAQYGASYFILNRKNFQNLHLLQEMTNYYLLDIKILALVNSCFEIQEIAYRYNSSLDKYIGIDGVVESNLLSFVKKNTCE